MASGTWYIAPKNEAANKVISILNPDVAFTKRSCFDRRGHLEEVEMAQISERQLERVGNDAHDLGLAYDTYFQEDSESAIEFRAFGKGEEANRNRISDSRLKDPFKKGRRARLKAGLPRKVFFGSSLLRG